MCLDETEHDKNFSLNTLGFENFHIKMYADRSMLPYLCTLWPVIIDGLLSSTARVCNSRIAFLAPLIVIPLNFAVVVVIVVSECTE